jgi:hypothetical protein
MSGGHSNREAVGETKPTENNYKAESEVTTNICLYGKIAELGNFQSKCLGGKVHGWIVRERDAEEINANRNINAQS